MIYKEDNEVPINDFGDYIKWEKKFEIGIPKIDEQHKRLVEICNRLYKALMQNRSSGEQEISFPVKTALSEAVNYVKVHFSAEEKLMTAVGYPDHDAHKKKHDQFIIKVLETSGDISVESFSNAFQFVRFMYDWILSHIAYEDRLYVDSVRAYLAKK